MAWRASIAFGKTSKATEFGRAIVISVPNHVRDPQVRARIEADVVNALGDAKMLDAAVDSPAANRAQMGNRGK
jgi:hypothetical protein